MDGKLEEEVKRGQLIRGTSPWGSPPFPTKDFGEHRKARKRRIVVDYRRVNARTARAVYFVRNASGVVQDCAGSCWMTLLDAVTGFNQIANTRRAREMLAILARSGQFLPICLTFGPHNGPEDFSFVIDRHYSPGRDAKRRFCTEWQAYVDDLTIRTGRVVDGQWFTDEEFAQRIRKAVKEQPRGGWQSVEDALDAQGFLPEGLGSEAQAKGVELPKGKAKPKKKPKYDPVHADRNHPYAHMNVYAALLFATCNFSLLYVPPLESFWLKPPVGTGGEANEEKAQVAVGCEANKDLLRETRSQRHTAGSSEEELRRAALEEKRRGT